MMRRLVALVAVSVIAVGCGSSGGGGASSGEGKDYVDAMMKSYDRGDGAESGFTRSQAQCVAEGVVGSVGVDKLKDAGVEPSDVAKKGDSPFDTIGKSLSRAEAEDLVGVLTDGTCFNFTDLVMKQAGSSTFSGVDKTKVRCLFDELLSNEAFKGAMVDSMLGRDTSGDAFKDAFSNESEIFDIMGKCKLSPSELSGN